MSASNDDTIINVDDDSIIASDDDDASNVSFESVIFSGCLTDPKCIVSHWDRTTRRMTRCFLLHEIDLTNENGSSSSSSSLRFKKNNDTQITDPLTVDEELDISVIYE